MPASIPGRIRLCNLGSSDISEIFAARDRFGIKPLFYAFHNETLYLASEVKALFAAGVPAQWDAESVYHSAEFGSHQVRTLFQGSSAGSSWPLPDSHR